MSTRLSDGARRSILIKVAQSKSMWAQRDYTIPRSEHPVVEVTGPRYEGGIPLHPLGYLAEVLTGVRAVAETARGNRVKLVDPPPRRGRWSARVIPDKKPLRVPVPPPRAIPSPKDKPVQAATKPATQAPAPTPATKPPAAGFKPKSAVAPSQAFAKKPPS